ncbi:MAG TPA: fluoride efflux transporter CrcB [Nocardioides sp.]|uniref:fluoride efflux transporter CrcB n=1 Tax=Nocardioides sp. TaxID=35761 RepID=UPI002F404407
MTGDLRELGAIFVGGAVGSVARAWVGLHVATAAHQWPWGTFLVNVVAAFLLGYFSTRLLERLPVSNYQRPFLGTGICGGLSTFSTMQIEVVRLFQSGAWVIGVSYVVASIVAGYVALHLATAVVRRAAVRW